MSVSTTATQAFPLTGPMIVIIVTATALLAAVGVLACLIRNSESTASYTGLDAPIQRS